MLVSDLCSAVLQCCSAAEEKREIFGCQLESSFRTRKLCAGRHASRSEEGVSIN